MTEHSRKRSAGIEEESVERTLTVDTHERRDVADGEEPSVAAALPDQLYRLKIELESIDWGPPDGEVSRTVELSGEDTPCDLHDIIQQGFDRDDDHLFSFFVSGKLRDRKPEDVGLPRLIEAVGEAPPQYDMGE